jgi:ankyrin repeat protein
LASGGKVNYLGNNALHIAVEKDYLAIAQELIDLGADPNIANKYEDDTHNNILLMFYSSETATRHYITLKVTQWFNCWRQQKHRSP